MASLEFCPPKKYIKQVQGFKNAHIEPKAPFFSGLCEILHYLQNSQNFVGEKRGIETIHGGGDTNDPRIYPIPKEQILTKEGSFLETQLFLDSHVRYGKEPVMAGLIKVSEDFSSAALQTLSQIPNVTLDMTDGTQRQREFIRSIHGSLEDHSTGTVVYPNLKRVAHEIRFPNAEAIRMEQLDYGKALYVAPNYVSVSAPKVQNENFIRRFFVIGDKKTVPDTLQPEFYSKIMGEF